MLSQSDYDTQHVNVDLSMVKTPLKDYQMYGVKWMVDKESTNYGGLLLDSCGLGKTLSLIAVSLSGYPGDKRPTLVICPALLVSTWVDEILAHTHVKQKDILVFEKHTNPEDINPSTKFIIVSMGKIVKHFDKESGFTNPFFEILFKRVIVDEAHYTRNPATVLAKSIFALRYDLAWCSTGTPVVNVAKDLYSLYKITEEVGDYQEFKSIYGKKVDKGMETLCESLAKIAIRREKSQVLDLKDKQVVTHMVDFNQDEQEFYTTLAVYTEDRVKALLRKYKLKRQGYAHIRHIILVLILRLRQCCTDCQMVIASMERIQGLDTVSATRKLNFYNQNFCVKEECGVCYDSSADVISECGHKLCKVCWKKLDKCPYCGELKDIDPPTESDKETKSIVSSKIIAGVELAVEKINKGEKVLVVSQWLDPLEKAVEELRKRLPGVGLIELNGSVNIKERHHNVKQFQEDPTIKVAFISLLSSCEGITLTKANNVIILDQWFNCAKTEQMADRVHRISQEKDVNIYHMMMKNTIELGVQKLVEKKHDLAEVLYGKKTETRYSEKWATTISRLMEYA